MTFDAEIVAKYVGTVQMRCCQSINNVNEKLSLVGRLQELLSQFHASSDFFKHSPAVDTLHKCVFSWPRQTATIYGVQKRRRTVLQ